MKIDKITRIFPTIVMTVITMRVVEPTISSGSARWTLPELELLRAQELLKLKELTDDCGSFIAGCWLDVLEWQFRRQLTATLSVGFTRLKPERFSSEIRS